MIEMEHPPEAPPPEHRAQRPEPAPRGNQAPAADFAPPGAGPAPTRRRARLIGVAIALALLAALLIWRPWRNGARPSGTAGASGAATGARRGSGRGRAAALANQAQPVRAATVATGDMPVVIDALGTVTPLATVTVKTQIAGTLTQVAFREGQMVRKGDLLALVDPRPYEISLRNARGQLARDQALLRQAQADLARYRALLKQDSIAAQQVQTQASLVHQYRGTVMSDQANIDTYLLDLAYCHITAPISGRVGLRQVDVGNYVTSGDTNGIVVITQLSPISVVFTVPEDSLPPILRQVNAGARLSVSAYDRAGAQVLESGYLATLDNQIDTSTGTVKLRADFTNRAGRLFPNQFVNTKLLVNALKNANIVPAPAVQNGANGSYVYVVRPDSTVTVRVITVGPADGERVSVLSGLAPGDRVVTDGSDRLKEGAKVTIPASGAGAVRPAGAFGASNATGISGASLPTAASAISGTDALRPASGAERHRDRREGGA